MTDEPEFRPREDLIEVFETSADLLESELELTESVLEDLRDGDDKDMMEIATEYEDESVMDEICSL